MQLVILGQQDRPATLAQLATLDQLATLVRRVQLAMSAQLATQDQRVKPAMWGQRGQLAFLAQRVQPAIQELRDLQEFKGRLAPRVQ